MLIRKSGLACAMAGALTSTPAIAQDEQLVRVTDVVPNGRVGQYNHGTYPTEGERTHAGVDIPAPCKTSRVQSWRDGVVIDLIDSKKDRNFKALGYMVIIDHGVVDTLGKRTFSSYFHLNDAPKRADGRALAINDTVTKAEQVGLVGQTGAAQGCHLHFELRHFSSRFSPDWLNIYGSGDRRSSPEFLRDWTDPFLKASTPPQNGGAVADGQIVEARVASAARERNKPTTAGSTILRTIPAGTTITGTWVEGTDRKSRWLKTGSSSFVWDGNLTIAAASAPVAAAAPVRPGFSRVHDLSASPARGTLSFDEPLKLLSDSTECGKAQKALVKKLSKPRAACLGVVTTPGHGVVFAENWLISEANPGLYQLIFRGTPAGAIAATSGGAVSAFEDMSGNLVIVSSEARDRSKSANLPYVLYRIEGGRLVAKTTRNFAKGDAPIDRNRRDFIAAVDKAKADLEAARLAAQAPANSGNDNPRSTVNAAVVKFRASCPGLFITRVFESKFEGLIPGYAMHVVNNSDRRYVVKYDMVYTQRADGVLMRGRRSVLTTEKSFTVRPQTTTQFWLEQKTRSPFTIESINGIEVFECSGN